MWLCRDRRLQRWRRVSPLDFANRWSHNVSLLADLFRAAISIPPQRTHHNVFDTMWNFIWEYLAPICTAHSGLILFSLCQTALLPRWPRSNRLRAFAAHVTYHIHVKTRAFNATFHTLHCTEDFLRRHPPPRDLKYHWEGMAVCPQKPRVCFAVLHRLRSLGQHV